MELTAKICDHDPGQGGTPGGQENHDLFLEDVSYPAGHQILSVLWVFQLEFVESFHLNNDDFELYICI